MTLGPRFLVGFLTIVGLSAARPSPVEAEEYRTAANALLCTSPMRIKDAYQAVLAGDRKWLQELNCHQAKAGLKVTVIDRSALGWQVRVNIPDHRVASSQLEHTATIDRTSWTAQAFGDTGARTNAKEANRSAGRALRTSQSVIKPIDRCCDERAAQDTPPGTGTLLWASWLEFRTTNGSYIDAEGRHLKFR